MLRVYPSRRTFGRLVADRRNGNSRRVLLGRGRIASMHYDVKLASHNSPLCSSIFHGFLLNIESEAVFVRYQFGTFLGRPGFDLSASTIFSISELWFRCARVEFDPYLHQEPRPLAEYSTCSGECNYSFMVLTRRCPAENCLKTRYE